MRRSIFLHSALFFSFLLAAGMGSVRAQSAPSRGERDLTQAFQQGKHAFLVFFRQQDAATDAMVDTLKQNLADNTEAASIVYVRIGDRAEQSLVRKYGVARAPMPLTMALAPNGAITAIHPRRIDVAKFDEAFVTAAGAQSLKALQEQKIVFVSVRNANHAGEPAAIAEFASDPHFRERMDVVSVDGNDAREREFLEELQVDTNASPAHAMVVLAPPGVLVGRFSAMTTKDQIASAIAEAGKCCDDPNCKHHERR